jgi:hypothetical protein
MLARTGPTLVLTWTLWPNPAETDPGARLDPAAPRSVLGSYGPSPRPSPTDTDPGTGLESTQTQLTAADYDLIGTEKTRRYPEPE